MVSPANRGVVHRDVDSGPGARLFFHDIPTSEGVQVSYFQT